MNYRRIIDSVMETANVIAGETQTSLDDVAVGIFRNNEELKQLMANQLERIFGPKINMSTRGSLRFHGTPNDVTDRDEENKIKAAGLGMEEWVKLTSLVFEFIRNLKSIISPSTFSPRHSS